MTALILVDIQNDFTAGGALAVPDGENIIPVVNELQPRFDLVVATQDWHPAAHKSFASSHPGRRKFDRIDLHGLDQVLWPDHCIQGTKGAEFHPDLNMNKVEAIFRKGMSPEIDSYSGFYDNGRMKSTGLAGYLQEREVHQVFVCGLAGDYCVYFTAMDSLKEGFHTFVISGATRAIDKDGFDSAMNEFTTQGGQVITHAM